MSGVLCVWADLPDSAKPWYENEFVPNMRAQNATHALHCELTANGMGDEPTGKLDSPWPLFTVYEVEELRKATDDCYDKKILPSDDLLAGPMKDARFDTRTYREVIRWQAEDWDGDISHIASIAAMEWRISADMKEEVLKFYQEELLPTICRSPDVLRFRNFEIDSATVLQGGSFVTKEKNALHTYFTMVEFDSEHWPWDVVVELAENPKWRMYFEAQVVAKWQVSHYIVERTYYTEIVGQPMDIDATTGIQVEPEKSELEISDTAL